MDAEPPLDYLLDGPAGPTPGRDELLAIVARSRARRYRVVAIGMAATLVVGALGGWLVGSDSGKSSGGATLAAGGSSTTAVVPSLAMGPMVTPGAVAPGGSDLRLVKRFVRTTSDGVTLRAYEEPGSGGVVPLTPCGGNGPANVETLPPTLDVEVSTAAVADQVYSGSGPSETPFPLSVSTIGVAEGAPVWVVTVRVTASVALVKIAFSDGKTDQMAPVADWAVLAHVVPKGSAGTSTSYGKLEAQDAAGRSIAEVTFPIAPVVTGSPTTSVFSPSLMPVTTVPETTVPGTSVGGTTIPAGGLAVPPTPSNTATAAAPPQTLPPAIVAPEPCITTTVPGGQ